MSLKPENLFTTLRLGLQLWTLRDDYIIWSTGEPLQIQRPKQWTKPVTAGQEAAETNVRLLYDSSENEACHLVTLFSDWKKNVPQFCKRGKQKRNNR